MPRTSIGVVRVILPSVDPAATALPFLGDDRSFGAGSKPLGTGKAFFERGGKD